MSSDSDEAASDVRTPQKFPSERFRKAHGREQDLRKKVAARNEKITVETKKKAARLAEANTKLNERKDIREEQQRRRGSQQDQPEPIEIDDSPEEHLNTANVSTSTRHSDTSATGAENTDRRETHQQPETETRTTPGRRVTRSQSVQSRETPEITELGGLTERNSAEKAKRASRSVERSPKKLQKGVSFNNLVESISTQKAFKQREDKAPSSLPQIVKDFFAKPTTKQNTLSKKLQTNQRPLVSILSPRKEAADENTESVPIPPQIPSTSAESGKGSNVIKPSILSNLSYSEELKKKTEERRKLLLDLPLSTAICINTDEYPLHQQQQVSVEPTIQIIQPQIRSDSRNQRQTYRTNERLGDPSSDSEIERFSQADQGEIFSPRLTDEDEFERGVSTSDLRYLERQRLIRNQRERPTERSPLASALVISLHQNLERISEGVNRSVSETREIMATNEADRALEMQALQDRVREMENQRREDQNAMNDLRQQLQNQQGRDEQQRRAGERQDQDGQLPNNENRNNNQDGRDRVQQARDAGQNELRYQNNAMQQTIYAMARKQAEKRINNLPNLTSNETEAVKSFIRQATNVWSTIDNEDTNTFMRIIKDKVIGCTWLPEIDIEEADTWRQIKTLLENKWREESDPALIRAKINELQQKNGETVTEFTKRAQKILSEYEQYHGNITQSHREEIEDRIREKYEAGLANKSVREAVIAHANTTLREAINVATRLQTRQEQMPQTNEFICNYCEKRGHRESDCKLKQKRMQQSNEAAVAEYDRYCRRCSTTGHSERTCFVARFNSDSNRRTNNNNNDSSNNNRFNNNRNNQSNYRRNDNFNRSNYNNRNNNNNRNDNGNRFNNNRSGQNYNYNNRNNNNNSNNYNNNRSNYNNQSNYNNNNNQRGNYNNGNTNNGNYRNNNRNYSGYQQTNTNQNAGQNNNANGFNRPTNQNWNRNNASDNTGQPRNQNATAFGAYMTPTPISMLPPQFASPMQTNPFIPLYNSTQLTQNATGNFQNLNNESEN